MSIAMKARTTFTNPRVSGPRPDGSLVEGDTFTTDWLHAKELQHLGLAEADDQAALEREPAEDLRPHNQISVADLAATNARRARARGEKGDAPAAAVTGQAFAKPAGPAVPPKPVA